MIFCSGILVVHPWQVAAQACTCSDQTTWLAFGKLKKMFHCASCRWWAKEKDEIEHRWWKKGSNKWSEGVRARTSSTNSYLPLYVDLCALRVVVPKGIVPFFLHVLAFLLRVNATFR